MYPSIDIMYNLLSRKVWNPDDFRIMRDFRLKMKADGNPKNKALKPMINGVYGASKDRNNPMYDPLMANLTCLFGQFIITGLVAKVEPYCKLIQTNTDGIFVLCKNEEMKEKVTKLAIEYGKEVFMEFEIEEYTKMIQSNVNNYIAVPLKGKLECKGAMVKKNTPIDNDMSIVNDAVRNYLAYDIPVEKTINECNELIKFQKIIKLTAQYKEIWYGNAITDKGKVVKIEGNQLKEKVHRIFASKDINDGGIYKLKIENKEKSYEKFPDTADHLFINNADIHDVKIPEKLDRQYYIDLANKRIKMFLDKTVDKVDETPNLLFECMNKSNNYREFVTNVLSYHIPEGTLRKYIVAQCCEMYGKTYRLLKFLDYYNIFIGKSDINVRTIDSKIKDENIVNVIKNNSELNNTGNKYINMNSNKILDEILNLIEDKDIDVHSILRQQVEFFNEPRYVNDELDDLYYVVSYRNIIAPNAILYNLSNGEFTYRKFDKTTFGILPLLDADIISIMSESLQYELKITGKNEKGENILEADQDRPYNLITSYDIVKRDYTKKVNTKVE